MPQFLTLWPILTLASKYYWDRHPNYLVIFKFNTSFWCSVPQRWEFWSESNDWINLLFQVNSRIVKNDGNVSLSKKQVPEGTTMRPKFCKDWIKWLWKKDWERKIGKVFESCFDEISDWFWSFSVIFARSKKTHYGPTDGRTDRRTDRRTDGQTLL